MENDQELLQIKFRQSVKLEHVASYSGIGVLCVHLY